MCSGANKTADERHHPVAMHSGARMYSWEVEVLGKGHLRRADGVRVLRTLSTALSLTYRESEEAASRPRPLHHLFHRAARRQGGLGAEVHAGDRAGGIGELQRIRP